MINDRSHVLTTDDTAPTTNATVYAGPFTVETSATISMIAFQIGLATSAVATASFRFEPSLAID